MDVNTLYPRVMSWMKEARASHPLSELIDSVRDGGSSPGAATAILAAFEQVIAGLEAVKPERLLTERADFRKARSWDDLLIVRAELVAGHKLAQAGVPFDFGVRGGSPQPDLVLKETELGIEVKARRLDGLRDLHNELEEALENAGAEVVVHIACRERPLYLKEAERRDLVSEVLDRVTSGSYGTISAELDQPWAATPKLPLALRIFPDDSFFPGQRVFIEGGEALAGHLANIESEVIAVLTADEQKASQAASMPTLLLVDIARAGVGWIRPERVWAQVLAVRLPETTPFIGAAVMVPRLDSPNVELAVAVRPDAGESQRGALQGLASRLGLSDWGGGWFG